jgi:hypothetical protein
VTSEQRVETKGAILTYTDNSFYIKYMPASGLYLVRQKEDTVTKYVTTVGRGTTEVHSSYSAVASLSLKHGYRKIN